MAGGSVVPFITFIEQLFKAFTATGPSPRTVLILVMITILELLLIAVPMRIIERLVEILWCFRTWKRELVF